MNNHWATSICHLQLLQQDELVYSEHDDFNKGDNQ